MLAFLSPVMLKAGAVGLAFLALIGGAFWFVHHERNIGAQRCEAAVKAATDTELARQGGINQDWQQWADSEIQGEIQQKAKMNDLEKQVADASAPLKGKRCLPVGVVDRLRAVDLSGGKANPPTGTGGTRR